MMYGSALTFQQRSSRRKSEKRRHAKTSTEQRRRNAKSRDGCIPGHLGTGGRQAGPDDRFRVRPLAAPKLAAPASATTACRPDRRWLPGAVCGQRGRSGGRPSADRLLVLDAPLGHLAQRPRPSALRSDLRNGALERRRYAPRTGSVEFDRGACYSIHLYSLVVRRQHATSAARAKDLVRDTRQRSLTAGVRRRCRSRSTRSIAPGRSSQARQGAHAGTRSSRDAVPGSPVRILQALKVQEIPRGPFGHSLLEVPEPRIAAAFHERYRPTAHALGRRRRAANHAAMDLR